MTKRVSLLLSFTAILALGVSCYGLSPANVAVVVNTNVDLNGASEAVGRYYCNQAGIPLSNLIGVHALTIERIPQAGVLGFAGLAADIRSALVSQLHVDPNNPIDDPIQCLVMCYGVPLSIQGDANSLTSENTSIDSYLTMLFSADPDLGPDVIDGDCLGPFGVHNPYYGKNLDFAAFRASSDNDIVYNDTHHAKMRYMVCRLDAYSDPKTPVVINGTSYNIPADVKALIDRAHQSAGQTGRFVLDEAWNSDPEGFGHGIYNGAAAALGGIIDPSLVLHDGNQSDCYLNAPGLHPELHDSTGVMGYGSFGMHDADIWTNADWARPKFNWKPGAIAIINESFGGAHLGDQNYVMQFGNGFTQAPPVPLDVPQLKVVVIKSDPSRSGGPKRAEMSVCDKSDGT